MKTLFVSLAALLFAFFVGCQSSITDPEMPDNTQSFGNPEEEIAVYKDVFNSNYPGTIILSGLVLDPSHRLNSYAEIKGIVRYGIKEVNSEITGEKILNFYKVSPGGNSPDKNLKVDLFVDASLKVNCPSGHNKHWAVKETAEQIVSKVHLNQSVVYIQKTFRVKNTCCAPLNLVMKFEVNEKELKLVSMELKIIEGLYPIVNQE
jgi:hypothetical protein